MELRSIDTHALPSMAWKNGGGLTRNLTIEPEDAGFDDFLWRVSIADVNQSGDFSRFPGVDRTIVLLEGDGMILEFDDGTRFPLTTPFVPHAFAGELGIRAKLTGEASRDFNLMVRRGRAKATVEVCRSECRFPKAASSVWFCARGGFRLLMNRGEVVIPSGHLFRAAPEEAPARAIPDTPGAVLIAVFLETTEGR